MGTSAFAVPSLRKLSIEHQVSLVVTQPDRPRGRGQVPAPPPVKEEAERLGLRIAQPEVLGDTDIAAIALLRPDVIVVAAYGKLLGPSLLGMPRLGCVNVHASLLPRYRGAAPIVWAIASGERETGVTIMRMDEGLDSGPVLLRRTVTIAHDDTGGSLLATLADVGAEALAEALAGLERGTLLAEPQDHSLATRAPKLKKQDALVRFARPAVQVRDLVRAMDPRPGAYALLEREPLRLFSAGLAAGSGEPGVVLDASSQGLVVACADGAVAFAELQFTGRRRMPAAEVLRGRSIPPGTRLS